MSLLQALRFPPRHPIRYALVVGFHCLAWSIVVAGLEYSARAASSFEETAASVLCIAVLILYGNWLQRRAVATLRCLFAGGSSLPPPRVSDFLPLSIGSVFSSLFMFSFVAIFVFVIQSLHHDLRAHIVATDATEVVAAVHLLARFAIIFVALTLLTVIYIVGLARYATEGEGHKAAQVIAEKLLLLNRSSSSVQYLLLQLLLLSGAAYLLELGIAFFDATRPLNQSFAREGGLAWQTFGVFAFACGFVLFWNASLHLLAQYARAIGMHADEVSQHKAKGKRDFTPESAGP